MTETNLYDSIALAEITKLQEKGRNDKKRDVVDGPNQSNAPLNILRTKKMHKADSLAKMADPPASPMAFLGGRIVAPAVKRMNLTDDERQKVTDYLQFILSQRK